MRRVFRAIAAIALLGLAVVGTGCNQTVRTASDEFACVYDSHNRHVRFQLQPGAEKKTNEEDKVVRLPASNRFYMATFNDRIRDPGAPSYYSGFDKNQTEVHIEGQLRFKFDRGRACEWYAKHGRRNADSDGSLRFNARGDSANDSGWLTWLAENFGVTMTQVTPSVTRSFDWVAATFHYPVNANGEGDLPEGEKPEEDTDDMLGRKLGEAFSAKLNANLGGRYFCGIDQPPGQNQACPVIEFQVIKVTPVDDELLKDRATYEKTKQELRTAEQTGRLREEQKASSGNQLALLKDRLKNARLNALIKIAECSAYANIGLDCSPDHSPLPIANGVSVNVGK